MVSFLHLLLMSEIEIICKLIPPNKAFMIKRVSTEIYKLLKDKKIDAIVKADDNFIDHFIKKLSLNTQYNFIEINFVNCNLNCVDNIIQEIKNILKNDKLKKLNLRGNNLEDENGEKIISILYKNTQLTDLDLSNNFLGDISGYAISRMLYINTTLIKLNLSNNLFSDDVVCKIARKL